ncbi:hypothetical protein EDC96DRAFT_585732 [Choanephora cucurbitarum]|nr:hypothetical protein EDC96DRAFT_585732 [Choanephora cucurbitarum]
MSSTSAETPIDQIALQIKSLEQRTTSVTISRTASVLDLKQEIKVAFDVDSDRQRLIFQGRVLKDDKHLTDYANLDNGKVVHLVVRPLDAPHNPSNDEPNSGSTQNRQSANMRGTNRIRSFPSISSRFPMMEGYAFITLDSTLSDIGDSQSLLSSVLNGIAGGMHGSGTTPNRTNSDTTSTTTTTTTTQSNTNPRTPLSSRTPFPLNLGRASPSDFISSLASASLSDRVASGLPFPPSVEIRLARTLGSMRNVRIMLEDSATNDDVSQFPAPNSTPEQLQEIRNRLRNSGNSQSAQIGMVLNELADLMTEAAPRMRQVAQNLRQENQTTEQERVTNRRVLNMSRIVQGMSLINHFLGSVLASADIDSGNQQRRSSFSSHSSTQNRPSSPVRMSSSLFSRGNTEAIRTSTPVTSFTLKTSIRNN